MTKKQFLDSFLETIAEYDNIAIVSHVNPDGDAVGSTLAFCFFLRKLGKNVNVLLPNAFPSCFYWLPGASDIILYDKNAATGLQVLSNADLFCFLDFNTPSRTGLIHNDLCHFTKTPILLVDHHRDPDLSKFKTYLCETETSSTSELVAEIIQYHGFDKYLDLDIAKCLLVGIMTDTGSFAHSIFHPETFDICSKLIIPGIDYTEIHHNVFDAYSENRVRLLGFSLSKMKVLPQYHTAYIVLCSDELERFDYQVGDTEGVVNYPLSIKEVNMSVLIKEHQGQIRFSFRSKGQFSVHEFAKDNFGGGGHHNAAGGSLNCSIAQAVDKLLEIIPAYKNDLDY